MSGTSAFGSASCGTFSSSTMIVMMTAIAASLKASSRALFMRCASKFIAAEYVPGSPLVQAGRPGGDSMGEPPVFPRSKERRRDACSLHSFEFCKDSYTQHPRLRGMPRDGRHLGASSPVPGVRTRRLLRRFEEQARKQAFQEDRASDHDLPRAGGELELVLCRRTRHGARM